ncbi:MAG: PaaI family thioesterase [Actinomycetota bacterium]|nr:PaaI family thioesterase [Actinomycetota bacterium]MEC9394625.1 PaaI family thioesterase [Actinomycetota bacterium]MED6328650.1 PaaI family thioesterase [Actinomycetota bacterium]MEE2957570.1 PaaI family thioesterase [Actinomycetota bacterium]
MTSGTSEERGSRDGAAELTSLVRRIMPFCDVLGLTVVSASPDRVEANVEWTVERTTVFGGLHGGYVMAVADSTGALCAAQNLADGEGTSTIESKTNFLRPIMEGVATIVSTPVHVGRTTIVVQTEVLRADGKRAAITTQTQAVHPAGA